MQEMSIADLHESTLEARNNRAIKGLLLGFACLTLVAAGLIVASLIWRDPTHLHNPNEQASQILTIGITILWGMVLIFLWSMKMSPRLSYRRYLRELRGGLSRTVEGMVMDLSEEQTFREGLHFYGMILSVGDGKDPEDERLLYWDAQLGRPDLAIGDRVRIHAHGNDIIGLVKEEGNRDETSEEDDGLRDRSEDL